MSEFGKDLGLVHEAVVTGRDVGADKEFWAALAHNKELFGKVVAFVASALKAVFNLVAKIDRDITGWTCVEPAEAEEGEFEPFLQEFLQKGESHVSGEEMVKRAEIKTGLHHAEAMLRNQEKIPAEWQKFYLVFTEVWRGPDGSRRVWCLGWGGGRWGLDGYWLDGAFDSSARLVGSRKYQK
ncbi:MAG: hypothetical protein NT026_03110 [Candidatus Staskawiczbacteria bacterium]|nr:hypothetical protein [Candidatus Staskawiczbacteria bacterium]